ncbi:hypothetical protein NPIL_367301 [Nephila pilipes]|uniref:Reverse transcriptase n=1 Tax=Nephila pilipes TaxID=299642 RepID=A0A8X6MWR8_NEPPI|nr:hypothetical protein NPIL_367301 [Nephila pilipes]
MRAGVRQGCPLSAILFNISLEQVLRTGISTPGFIFSGKKRSALPMPTTCCFWGSPLRTSRAILTLSVMSRYWRAFASSPLSAPLSFSYTRNSRTVNNAQFLVAGRHAYHEY